MRSRGARIVLVVIGVVAVLVGSVWMGQGANLIGGSSMTGSQMWFTIGIVVAIAGVGMLVLGLRRRGPRS